jgi:DNA polymerase III epsilon subunit family exonuclease
MVDQVDAEQASEVAYPHLVERAIACIEDNGGVIAEDQLIAIVFGHGGNPALWRPLLRTMLQGHPIASLRADGVWTTGKLLSEIAFPHEFVVIDIETTGLKPSQQRIIEIGVIRVSPHGSPLRWSTLLNPGRRIPDYIASLTGIDDSMVASAPEFRSIAPTIVDIVEDLPIVGHNVAFDLGFLNAEMVRGGLHKLVNPAIDTLALTSGLVAEARKLNLGDVARVLGITTREAHRALADAETTLAVFMALLDRARGQGLTTLDDLLRLNAGKRAPVPVHKPVGRGRSILDKSHLTSIPHAPGVYIMRDAGGRVIYIGKARDLRKRVASYYSQPLGYTRKMDGLLESLTKIEVEVVGSEIEALMLESQLIRRYRPRFNTVQRNVEQYVYVRVDVSNPWPRVTTCKDRADDGASYFGPFRSASRAREAVGLVNDILPLRTCKRSFTDRRSYGSPCLELSLNRCLGPCMGVADPEVYRRLVHDVLDFFHGDDQRLIATLHAKLEETVATLDFERAARLRDKIKRVDALAREQRTLDTAAEHTHALLVLPSATHDAREVWYLLRGRRWAQLTVRADDSTDDMVNRLQPIIERARGAESQFLPDHHAVDEMAILSRWLRKTPDHPALISLDTCDLEEACALARCVDLTIPFGEGGAGDGADDPGDAEYD